MQKQVHTDLDCDEEAVRLVDGYMFQLLALLFKRPIFSREDAELAVSREVCSCLTVIYSFVYTRSHRQLPKDLEDWAKKEAAEALNYYDTQRKKSWTTAFPVEKVCIVSLI